MKKRVAVEMGVSLGWERWAGDEGAIVALDHFGTSAPGGNDPEGVRVHRGRGRPRSGGGSSGEGFRGRR